jgi:hypothetical protein
LNRRNNLLQLFSPGRIVQAVPHFLTGFEFFGDVPVLRFALGER